MQYLGMTLTVQLRIRLPVCCIDCHKEANIKRLLHRDICSIDLFNVLFYKNAGVQNFPCFFGQHGYTGTREFPCTFSQYHCKGTWKFPCTLQRNMARYGNFHVPYHIFRCKVHGNFHVPCNIFRCKVHGNFHVPFHMFHQI